MSVDLDELERKRELASDYSMPQPTHEALERTYSASLHLAAPALFAELRELRLHVVELQENEAADAEEIAERDSLRAEVEKLKNHEQGFNGRIEALLREAQESRGLAEKMRAQLATAHAEVERLNTQVCDLLKRADMERAYATLDEEVGSDGTVREGTK